MATRRGTQKRSVIEYASDNESTASSSEEESVVEQPKLKRKKHQKVELIFVYNGVEVRRQCSLNQDVSTLMQGLKKNKRLKIPKGNYCLINQRTSTKIPAKLSLSGHGVVLGDTLTIQKSDPKLNGKYTGAFAKHSEPKKPTIDLISDLMSNLDSLMPSYSNVPQNCKNYVIIDEIKPPPKELTLLELLKIIRWSGTLTTTTEEDRKKQHQEAKRFDPKEHHLLVFHEIGESSTDSRFQNLEDEMHAYETVFSYIRSKCCLFSGWSPGLGINHVRSLLKLIDKPFIEKVIRKCLSAICQFYKIPDSFNDDIQLLSEPVLQIHPTTATVSAAKGTSTHQLANSDASRLAIKDKSSNNNEYRLKVKSNAVLEVTCLNNAPKEDKLIKQSVEVAADVIDTQTPLEVSPEFVVVPAAGGTSTHQLTNSGAFRLAFKIKITDVFHYFTEPVFGFVEPGASTALRVTRLNGAPKEDKLFIQFVEVVVGVSDAEAPFKLVPPAGKIILPLKAE